MFETIKMMGDLVKGGIASVKAVEKLDAVVTKSLDKYEDKIKPEEKELYLTYLQLKDKYDREKDMDKKNAMMEKVEQAEIEYLLALTKNQEMPQAFKKQILEAIAEYHKADKDMMEKMKSRFLKMAANDEERAEVEQAFKEMEEEKKE